MLDQAPVSGSTIVLDGSWPVAESPTQLSGGDFEDGIYDGDETTGSQTIIKIISEPVAIDGTPSVQPELFYDGVKLSAGDLISNYEQSKLEVKLNGVGYKGFQFTYKTIDAAGAESNTATYKVTWPTALPVKLINFKAAKERTTAQISWTTTEETNSDRFEVERSGDAKSWMYIGEKAASGESKATLNYSLTDLSPLSGNNYYRLKMLDKDDTYTYSRIQSVSFDQTGLKLMLHPNPVSDILFVKDAEGHAITLNKVKEVSIANTQGVVVYKSVSADLSKGISVSGLAAGIYVVKITLVDGTQSTQKVIVGR